MTQAPVSHNHNHNHNHPSVNSKSVIESENTNNAQIISLLKEIIINKKKFTSTHYREIPILPQLIIKTNIRCD